jgi:hypothetical protein
MVKVMFLTIAFGLILSSVGPCAVAAPAGGMGDVQIGYNYYGFTQSNSENSRSGVAGNETYGKAGIGFGYGVFANRLQADGISYTDLGISGKQWIPHMSLQVGQRWTNSNNADTISEPFYGVTFSQSFSRKLSAEIIYQKGVHFTTEIFGITYDVTNLIQVGLIWKKNIDDHNKVALNGIGGGLHISF